MKKTLIALALLSFPISLFAQTNPDPNFPDPTLPNDPTPSLPSVPPVPVPNVPTTPPSPRPTRLTSALIARSTGVDAFVSGLPGIGLMIFSNSSFKSAAIGTAAAVLVRGAWAFQKIRKQGIESQSSSATGKRAGLSLLTGATIATGCILAFRLVGG